MLLAWLRKKWGTGKKLNAFQTRLTGGSMKKYKSIVGVSILALEEELNTFVSGSPEHEVVQIFYAQGTGFVAVLACDERDAEPPHETTGKATTRSKKARSGKT